jgi:hypothetical protein
VVTHKGTSEPYQLHCSPLPLLELDELLLDDELEELLEDELEEELELLLDELELDEELLLDDDELELDEELPPEPVTVNPVMVALPSA